MSSVAMVKGIAAGMWRCSVLWDGVLEGVEGSTVGPNV